MLPLLRLMRRISDYCIEGLCECTQRRSNFAQSVIGTDRCFDAFLDDVSDEFSSLTTFERRDRDVSNEVCVEVVHVTLQ
ncbi:hypothetical protein EGJ56_19205 [Pandoraea apista]|nr:hypothetical protein EGJ56_19205 [Pandoraea apista]